LLHGKTQGRKDLAERFHVNERSIQRDMKILRFFLAEQRLPQELILSKGGSS